MALLLSQHLSYNDNPIALMVDGNPIKLTPNQEDVLHTLYACREKRVSLHSLSKQLGWEIRKLNGSLTSLRNTFIKYDPTCNPETIYVNANGEYELVDYLDKFKKDIDKAEEEKNKNHIPEYLAILEECASKGCARAFRRLGVEYMEGKIVEQDCQKGLLYYFKAHILGDYDATFNLGCLFFYGKRKQEKDYAVAFELFKIGAKRGEGDSMFHLSYMYQNELGTSKNEELAEKWRHEAHIAGIDSLNNYFVE